MKLLAFGLTGISVASISAAFMLFDSPGNLDEIAIQANIVPAVIAEPSVASQAVALDAAPEIRIAALGDTPEIARTSTLVAASTAAVSEPEYVLCAVWFLGKISDQLRGIDAAEARSSHTVPLPGPLWLMQKIRSANS